MDRNKIHPFAFVRKVKYFFNKEIFRNEQQLIEL
jgi:hypothetical protein